MARSASSTQTSCCASAWMRSRPATPRRVGAAAATSCGATTCWWSAGRGTRARTPWSSSARSGSTWARSSPAMRRRWGPAGCAPCSRSRPTTLLPGGWRQAPGLASADRGEHRDGDRQRDHVLDGHADEAGDRAAHERGDGDAAERDLEDYAGDERAADPREWADERAVVLEEAVRQGQREHREEGADEQQLKAGG